MLATVKRLTALLRFTYVSRPHAPFDTIQWIDWLDRRQSIIEQIYSLASDLVTFSEILTTRHLLANFITRGNLLRIGRP